jgi:hypothetical protein
VISVLFLGFVFYGFHFNIWTNDDLPIYQFSRIRNLPPGRDRMTSRISYITSSR